MEGVRVIPLIGLPKILVERFVGACRFFLGIGCGARGSAYCLRGMSILLAQIEINDTRLIRVVRNFKNGK